MSKSQTMDMYGIFAGLGRFFRENKFEEAVQFLDTNIRSSQQKEYIEGEITFRLAKVTIFLTIMRDIPKATAELAQLRLLLRRAERCKSVEDLSPYLTSFYIDMGKLRLSQNRSGAAEQAFARAVRINRFEKNYEPHLWLVEALIENTKTGQAMKVLDEILQRDPTNQRALNLRKRIEEMQAEQTPED